MLRFLYGRLSRAPDPGRARWRSASPSSAPSRPCVSAERVAPTGLTPPHAGLLRAVAAGEGRSQQALAAQLGCCPAVSSPSSTSWSATASSNAAETPATGGTSAAPDRRRPRAPARARPDRPGARGRLPHPARRHRARHVRRPARPPGRPPLKPGVHPGSAPSAPPARRTRADGREPPVVHRRRLVPRPHAALPAVDGPLRNPSRRPCPGRAGASRRPSRSTIRRCSGRRSTARRPRARGLARRSWHLADHLDAAPQLDAPQFPGRLAGVDDHGNPRVTLVGPTLAPRERGQPHGAVEPGEPERGHGGPPAPAVATLQVRCSMRNASSSSSVMAMARARRCSRTAFSSRVEPRDRLRRGRRGRRLPGSVSRRSPP